MAPRLPRRAAKAPAAGRPRRSLLWRWRRALFLTGLLFASSVAGAVFVLSQVELPPETPLRQTTFICSAAVTTDCGPDNAIASLSAEQDRINVGLEEVSPIMIDAVLAAEDRDFFDHGGIDPFGIARAAVADLRGGAAKQGGSTITQQYVKNVYLTSERTITRKLKEAVLAIKLEREFDKQEILERYLNTIYFGRGSYGVQAAARAYFGVDASELQLHQAAYLAGLIRAPESADATRSPEDASRRRRTVLRALLETGKISQPEYEMADAMPWSDETVRPRTPKEGLGAVVGEEFGTEYFVEYIRRLLIDEYGEDMVYGGGLRVYTSLDLQMQEHAWNAISEVLDRPDTDPAAALVAIDEIGGVKAMVGGRDFEASEVNLALGAAAGGSGRQPGSAFKPFVLAQALREGISPASAFEAPGRMTFPGANAGADWKVANYGGTEQGVLDLVDATRVSSNTVYAQLMLEVGPPDVVDLARRMGITAELPAVNSLVLGTGEVSVLDMASAYTTFASRGIHRDPMPIIRVERVTEDGETRVVDQIGPDDDRVLSEAEADTVNSILRQVIQNGTGSSAGFGRQAAGKTGTTQDNRDAWFVGYTPRLTAAVWMGYPGKPGEEPRFMDDVRGRSVTGGSFPATIWRNFMANALDGVESGTFAPAPPFTGRILNSDLTPTDEEEEETTTTSTEETTTTTATEETTTTTAEGTTTTAAPPPSTTAPPPSSTTAPPSTLTPQPP